MIKIPQCLYCVHCEKNMRCVAFPGGILDKELHKHREDGEICKGTIKYQKKVLVG